MRYGRDILRKFKIKYINAQYINIINIPLTKISNIDNKDGDN